MVGRYERGFITAEALQRLKARSLVQRVGSHAPALLHLTFHQPRVCRVMGQSKTSPSWVVRDQHSVSGSGDPWARREERAGEALPPVPPHTFPWATAVGNCWRQDTGLEGSVVSLRMVVFMLYSVKIV